MTASFEATDASLVLADRALLERLSFELPPSGITALLGPGGAGKSLLLRALCGDDSGSPRLVVRGHLLHRGRPPSIERSGQRALYVRQASPTTTQESALAALLRATVEASELDRDLLVDEAIDRLAESERREGADALRALGRSRKVVVVTHDVSFARELADHVVLLAGGTVVASGPSPAFFEAPPNELARRFVEQGNCWPPAPPPPLPSHFHFVVPERLAGMGRPGLLGEIDDDLEAIAHAGIKMLVSLTETPFPPARLRSFGIAPRSFPIPDMAAPAIDPTIRLCSELARTMERGDAVAVHCHAGLGRTGTILGALRIWSGRTPDEAIAELRAIRRGYVQTASQADFLHRFAREL